MEKPTVVANLFMSSILAIIKLWEVCLITNVLPLIALVDPFLRLR